jgi:hypothetical protein
MKVKIGSYTKYHSVYSLASAIIFWDNDKYAERNTLADKLGNRLAKIEWLVKVIQKFNSIQKRKIYVRIDNHDCWSLDHTLALIIAPSLKKLKELKNGSPQIDDEDVPYHLTSTAAPKLTEEEINCGHADENYHLRWDWVLDEMIWTFDQYLHEDKNEEQFSSGIIDFNIKNNELEIGPNHTYKTNEEGLKLHRERMENGRRLFAKYYDGLWH